jgi:hypothetical protein
MSFAPDDLISRQVLDAGRPDLLLRIIPGPWNGFGFAVTAQDADAEQRLAGVRSASALPQLRRITQDAMLHRRAVPVALDLLVALHQHAGFSIALDSVPCGSKRRLSRAGTCAAQRRRRLHSADHRLAGICAGHLLARGTRTIRRQQLPSRQQPSAPGFLLDRSDPTCAVMATGDHRDASQNAYAHHIQRLMVTGNFALLIAVHRSQGRRAALVSRGLCRRL